jgi:hypothetical protein
MSESVQHVTKKVRADKLRSQVVSRIETREYKQEITEAMRSVSASTYVFTVQNYQWEVQS